MEDKLLRHKIKKLSFHKVNKRSFTAFVTVFVLVGLYFLINSFANPPVLESLQAEHMKLPKGASVITDMNASGGQAVVLNKSGTLKGDIYLPEGDRTNMLTVIAHGNKCDEGYSNMSVSVDGKIVINHTPMTGNVWNPYTVNLSLTKGIHNIEVSGDGIAWHGACERMLYVDVVNLYGSSAAPKPTVAFSASPVTIMEGASSTLTWTSTSATSCLAGGGWSGSEPTSGSLNTGALSATTVYSITCKGAGGKIKASVMVTVKPLPASGNSNGSSTGTTPKDWWKPSSSTPLSWDWVLANPPAAPYQKVDVYDIDGFDNTATTVQALHAQNTKVICYMDAGTYEPGRPDLNLIPPADIGKAVSGWPGEKWLNIADIQGLTPLIQERMNLCKSKGFDAIEPDNIDGYSNSTGFTLTASDQLAYNEFLASTAHSLGLSIGLKNDTDQAMQLVPYFDWMLNEECSYNSECDKVSSFVSANKAVFDAEYTSDNETTAKFCSADASAHINGALFNIALDGKTFDPCTGTW